MTFKRGDGVVFVGLSTTYYIDQDMEKRSVVTVGTVTSITREGQIRLFRPAGYSFALPPKRLCATTLAQSFRMPKENWNIKAVMDYCERRPWSHNLTHKGMPFDTLEQAGEELRQFRIKEKVRA
jgi:hypothetical protein